MRQINERINWLEKAISTLRAYRKKRDFSKFKESEIIISICEYEEELKALKNIKEANKR
jgi:hypothetical protein